MTDAEAIEAALSAVDPRARDHVLLTRNGRPFMALPASRAGALHAVNLYQPQRPKAVLAMLGIRALANVKLHRTFFPSFHGIGGKITLDPEFRGCLPGTAGVMLGSPEHRVRRAILSYRTHDGWEVAKLAFGAEGRGVVLGEYDALRSMPTGIPGIPKALGIHHGELFTMLRLPYLHGQPMPPRHETRALNLLDTWIRDLPELPACAFPEWPAIRQALETSEAGFAALAHLSETRLRPVIRHGDFARWNLLQLKDNSCMAIDWEWGHSAGMPGIDLVHFFAQDARLVACLTPSEVIRSVRHSLAQGACRRYLARTGWGDNKLSPILASIAYTVGTSQQANEGVLEVLLQEFSQQNR